MQVLVLTGVVLALTVISFQLGRSRSMSLAAGDRRKLHSLPSYYGSYVALWCGIPALVLMVLWSIGEPYIITKMVLGQMPADALTGVDGGTLSKARLDLLVTDIRNTASGDISSTKDPLVAAAAEHYVRLKSISFAAMTVVVLALTLAAGAVAYRFIAPQMRARNQVEVAVKWFMVACSALAVLTTLGIVLSLLFESIRFFNAVPITEFIFGVEWSPQTAMRADQVGSSGAFGAVPLFAGTLLISLIAMTVAVPIGLLSAIYMAEYAPRKVRAFLKPVLEILAGVPTVVYGFFAALTIAPSIRGLGEILNLEAYGFPVSSESALAAGMVMGIMIIPFISSLSDDVITAVPQSMREGSYGLGATQSETIKRVVLPAALPGVVGGVLLAVSRAIGETMIVVMAAGLSANLTANPFEAVTTVTVQIVTLLVGDQEFDSPKTLAAFALGLVLFIITLCLNVVALHVVRKYREQYE